MPRCCVPSESSSTKHWMLLMASRRAVPVLPHLWGNCLIMDVILFQQVPILTTDHVLEPSLSHVLTIVVLVYSVCGFGCVHHLRPGQRAMVDVFPVFLSIHPVLLRPLANLCLR